MSIFGIARGILPLVCGAVICTGSVSSLWAIPAPTPFPVCQILNEEQDEDVDIQELMVEGQGFIEDREYDNAAAIYRKVIKADPNNAFAWQLLGYSLHVGGKLDEAIEAHTKAATFGQVKSTALYNLACAWSLKKDTEKAFDFLPKALEAGFDNASLMRSDPDLDSIRSDERFAPLLQWCRTGKKPEGASPLVGKWAIGSGMKAGEAAPLEDVKVVFEITDNQILMPGPNGEEGFVMNYKIDNSHSPMQIDMNIESGPTPDGKAVGIVRVEDGQMTLCYDPTGATRPDKFESSEENGFFLFKSKKVQTEPAAGLDISGTWTFSAGVRAGADVPEDRMTGDVVIDGETITMPAGEDSFVMGYTIDATTSPASIDMKVLSGPAPEGSVAVGILKRDGDTLTLCYNAMGEDRPANFESTTDNGFFLFELKPKK
jgi:uncharacterized protein (TIGR03067 family)